MGFLGVAPLWGNVIIVRFVLRGLMTLSLVGMSAPPAFAADGMDAGDTA